MNDLFRQRPARLRERIEEEGVIFALLARRDSIIAAEQDGACATEYPRDLTVV